MTAPRHILCWYFGPGTGWLRIWGPGIAWKDTRRYGLRFSERNGRTKYWLIGSWAFKMLKTEPA